MLTLALVGSALALPPDPEIGPPVAVYVDGVRLLRPGLLY